jgi:hypothetical protein
MVSDAMQSCRRQCLGGTYHCSVHFYHVDVGDSCYFYETLVTTYNKKRLHNSEDDSRKQFSMIVKFVLTSILKWRSCKMGLMLA